MNSSTPVLGIPISTFGMDSAVRFCATAARARRGGYVCFANVHTVTESQGSAELRAALSDALLTVADGLPLVWVSRLGSAPIASRVCGPDFMESFLEHHKDLGIGFIGGAPGQAEKLAERFSVSATCYSPPMRPFSREAAEEDWRVFTGLRGSKPMPDAVWVGLGAPKQELWMNAVSKVAPGTLFFGVGAAFDFLAGTKKRAPLWMQEIGLEWLFRLIQEPARLWKRYLVFNSRFLCLVAKEQAKSWTREGPG